MDFQFIRNTIQGKIDEGYNHFVIYPLSEIGIRIKECLIECFGENPIVVDNGLSKYNSRLETGETLKKLVTDTTCVFIATEFNGIIESICDELTEYCVNSQIVVLNRMYEKYVGDLKRLHVDSFMPESYYSINNIITRNESGKIKVRFLHVTHTTWNTIKTIFEAFNKDERFSVQVILTSPRYGLDRRISQMKEMGCNYTICYNYDAKKDQPDIVIMNHPWDMTYVIDNLRENTRYMVAATATVITYEADDKAVDEIFFGAFSHYKPDVYLFDTLVYKKLMSAGKYPYKIVEMGNPKYDGIYNACRKKQYPVGWEKFRNKKVILYTTDHGVPNRIHDDISFDLYAKEIFEYFSQHKEMGLIFRPHQTFVSDMLEAGIWTKEELEKAKEFFRNTENIIWDDTDSYDVAYSISDGILSDAHCGILVSALPTLKPIAVLNRYDRNVPVFEGEIVKNYYQINSKEDLVVFFEMIANENDPMKEQRVICAKENVKNFDGKNGERIYQFIVDSYLREYLDN